MFGTVQAEGVLTFDLNTRAYGPDHVLTDAEVRRLATNQVDCVTPPGKFPEGTVKSELIAVDADGKVIEVISTGEVHGVDCLAAIGQWKFSPIMENGQPRPYRAQIDFHLRAAQK